MDATIIHAPSSTKNRSGERDPEMHQTRKGKQWYFGLKAHIGVDSKQGHVHAGDELHRDPKKRNRAGADRRRFRARFEPAGLRIRQPATLEISKTDMGSREYQLTFNRNPLPYGCG